MISERRALNVNYHLQIIGIHPDVDDAASDDDVHVQFLGSSNQLRAFRPGIEPDFSNGFLGNLFDDLQADLRREVKTGGIQPRYRDLRNRTVSRQPLNHFGFGMNWKYLIASCQIRANGLIAEFRAVGAGAQNGYGRFCHWSRTKDEAQNKKPSFPRVKEKRVCRNLLCGQIPRPLGSTGLATTVDGAGTAPACA